MSRANPVIVGGFVVGGIALAVGAIVVLAAEGASGTTRPFVVQIEGTANGLRVGAPVKFKGVQVGTVERIAIRVMQDRKELPIAVFCTLDEERVEQSSFGGDRHVSIEQLVESGLRARLETESLVTGIRYIATTFETDPGKRHGDIGKVPEVPWLPSSTELMETGAERVIEKLQQMDLVGLVDEAKQAVKSIGELGASPEVRSAITNLDHSLTQISGVADTLAKETAPFVERLTKTVDSVDALVKNLDAGLGEARTTVAAAEKLVEHADQSLEPFTSSLTKASDDVGGAARDFSSALGTIDGSTNPNAPLIVQLHSSLAELAGAARAARLLLEQLDRDPSQLLRGRDAEGASR